MYGSPDLLRMRSTSASLAISAVSTGSVPLESECDEQPGTSPRPLAVSARARKRRSVMASSDRQRSIRRMLGATYHSHVGWVERQRDPPHTRSTLSEPHFQGHPHLVGLAGARPTLQRLLHLCARFNPTAPSAPYPARHTPHAARLRGSRAPLLDTPL